MDQTDEDESLAHRPLNDLLALYRKKHSFKESAHLLNAMVYFDDANDDPMPSMIWDVRWTDVRSAFRFWVKPEYRHNSVTS